jgi:hypothetical protein
MGAWLRGYANPPPACESSTALFARWLSENPTSDVKTVQKFGRRMREFSSLYPKVEKKDGHYYMGLRCS